MGRQISVGRTDLKPRFYNIPRELYAGYLILFRHRGNLSDEAAWKAGRADKEPSPGKLLCPRMFLSQVSKSAVYCQALARPEPQGPNPAGSHTFGDDSLVSEPCGQSGWVCPFCRFMQVLALSIKRLKAEECFYLFERSEL